MHLFKDNKEVIPCLSDDAEINELLIQTSQMYEASRENGENDETIDNLASQEVENHASCRKYNPHKCQIFFS